jgi:hypothetical protein
MTLPYTLNQTLNLAVISFRSLPSGGGGGGQANPASVPNRTATSVIAA